MSFFMIIFIKISITAIVFLVSYFFIQWILFLFMVINDNLAIIISFLIAFAISFLIWRKIRLGLDRARYILLGGVIIGSIGFAFGFFGPLIFTPEANQGPFLGIFFTGPIGFILGLLIGSTVWFMTNRTNKK